MKTLFLILNLFVISNAFADNCTVTFPHKIIFTHKSSLNELVSAIQFNNCLELDQLNLMNEIKNLQGSVTADYLSRTLSTSLNKNITIIPDKFDIYELNSYLNTLFNYDSKIKFFNSQIIGRKQVITISNDQFVKANCVNCNNPGHQNLELISESPITNEKIIYNLSADIFLKANVYKAIQAITPFTDNLKSYFIASEAYLPNTSDFVSSSESIEFKSNLVKINPGDYLKRSHVRGTTMIKALQIVDVTYEQSGISLKTRALAQKSGSYGETIPLVNQKSRKIFFGTIIGENQVRVSL